MIAVELRFLTGRYHATPWGRNVNEGVPEWPPSPYRFVRALYDVWKRKYDGENQKRIEELFKLLGSEHPQFSLPPAIPCNTRAYLATYDGMQSSSALVFDPFMALEKGDTVTMIWQSLNLDETQMRDLSDLLSLLNYFGRSETWVSCVVRQESSPKPNCSPSDGDGSGMGSVEVACPIEPNQYSLDVQSGVSWFDAMADTSKAMLERGSSSPLAFQLVKYIFSEDFSLPKPRAEKHPILTDNCVLYQLESSVLPPVVDTVIVAERIRRKLMGIHRRLIASDKVSAKFSGKDEAGVPLHDHHTHAYILPIDRDSDGKLDHIMIVTKTPFSDTEMLALDALHSIWQTNGKPDIFLTVVWTGKQEDFEWNAPAAHYQSVTPFIPSRYWRKGRGEFLAWLEGELGKELQYHGFPKPIRITPLAYASTSGGRRLYWFEFVRCRKDEVPRKGYGFDVWFDAPIQGPIAAGYAAHFGMGMLKPVP